MFNPDNVEVFNELGRDSSIDDLEKFRVMIFIVHHETRNHRSAEVTKSIRVSHALEVIKGGVGDFLSLTLARIFDIWKCWKRVIRALSGGKSRRLRAVIVDVKGNLSIYLIPFKGVGELERPRTLLKLKDRFYCVLSNRSFNGKYSKILE